MKAEKAILETDQYGRLLRQPDLPPNTRIEAIFLILDGKGKIDKKRKPSVKIMGKGRITGDIMAPVVPPEDWGVTQ